MTEDPFFDEHDHGGVLHRRSAAPRLDLVAAIRARIAAGEYHQNTLEGDLAINLVADKLTEKLKGNE